MSILNDAAAMRSADPGGMHAHMERFSEHLLEALEIGRSAELSVDAERLGSVVVLGMGGSAIGGELAAGLLAGEMPVPMQVVRNYELPAFVGPDTLIVASSYSGNTEETLSGYADARARGARIVCSTTGGELGRLAGESGGDVVSIPKGLPPRAALAYGLVPLLVVFHRLGLIADPARGVEEAAGVASELAGEYGLDVPAEKNQAKSLAQWFSEGVPVVYGTTPATGVVAARWCGQIAENSKTVGHPNVLPEMNHNEIVGWGEPLPFGESGRAVFLKDSDDHPRVARRIEITSSMIREGGGEVREFASRGECRLARLLSLVVLGDFTSLYLAHLNGADPTPVSAIDRLKKALSES